MNYFLKKIIKTRNHETGESIMEFCDNLDQIA